MRYAIFINVSSKLRYAAAERLDAHFGKNWRTHAISYLQVFFGTGARLGLTAVYFFVLANTLSIENMAIFASISAAGMMSSCWAGFGFSGTVFRVSAKCQNLLGVYLGIFYVCLVVSIPILFAILSLIYYLLFRNSLSFGSFSLFILVEVVFWRIIESIQQVNNGLGAYMRASFTVMLTTFVRCVGACLFALNGGGTVEKWAVFYFVSNLIGTSLVFFLYRPKVRLRFSLKLAVGRLRDALLFASSYFAIVAQSEVDKLVMFTFANEIMTGIFAISSRIIDFTGVPFKSFYVLYSRRLIRNGKSSLSHYIKIELLIAIISTLGFGFLLVVLTIKPELLGSNIQKTMKLLGLVIAVPAFKNLLDFHAELYFASQDMISRAVISNSTVVLKALALIILLKIFPNSFQWGLWLNIVYVVLYMLSAVILYRIAFRRGFKH